MTLEFTSICVRARKRKLVGGPGSLESLCNLDPGQKKAPVRCGCACVVISLGVEMS